MKENLLCQRSHAKKDCEYGVGHDSSIHVVLELGRYCQGCQRLDSSTIILEQEIRQSKRSIHGENQGAE